MVEKLYLTYKEDVFKYLLGITHSYTLAEELLSDTFFEAIKSFHTFKGKSSEKTWLIGIAKNMWLRHLRKHKKEITLDTVTLAYIEETPLENIIIKETAVKIISLIENLTEKEQSVLKMRIEGEPYSEISKKIAISETTARTLDFRAKRKLQKADRKSVV